MTAFSTRRNVVILGTLLWWLAVVCSSHLADATSTTTTTMNHHHDRYRIGSWRAATAFQRIPSLTHVALTTRGGANDGEDEDSDEDSDSSDSEDQEEESAAVADENEVSDDDESEEDAYTDDEEDEETVKAVTVTPSKSEKKKKKQKGVEAYDEPFFMSPSMYLYTTFVPILISRKLDLYQPRVVRLLRFLFITQLVIQQAFIFYVRVMAKIKNDRTMIHIENPANAALKAQMDGTGLGSNDMVKNLMSSFLSRDTTVMEYDMDQAKGMQTGIIVTMIITWFFHFKLQQVQPLLVTIISGYFQLFYNPLFQVYILGRNLERPFKAPKPAWIVEDETDDAAEDASSTTDSVAETEATIEDAQEEAIVEEEAIEVEKEEDDEESSDSDSDEKEDEDEE